MKYIALIAIILAGIFLSAGCIAEQGATPVVTPAPVATTHPVVTVPTTQVSSWSWEYTPLETQIPSSLPKMAGRVYCYSGKYLAGCVGFNVSDNFYLETTRDVTGATTIEEITGDDTVAKYGTWSATSPTKVYVETTHDMYNHFKGRYDDSTMWECGNPECTTVFEPLYEIMYEMIDDAFI
jgi:hypothetical protein